MMAIAQSVSKEHITKTPGVCGGKACIAGHRVRVIDIVVYHRDQGLTPQEILELFPSITLADIHAAIAYYLDFPDEIAAEFAREQRIAEEFRDRFPSKIQDALVKHLELKEKLVD